eukprot:4871998-Pyramimonas_sp.AAC.1
MVYSIWGVECTLAVIGTEGPYGTRYVMRAESTMPFGIPQVRLPPRGRGGGALERAPPFVRAKPAAAAAASAAGGAGAARENGSLRRENGSLRRGGGGHVA